MVTPLIEPITENQIINSTTPAQESLGALKARMLKAATSVGCEDKGIEHRLDVFPVPESSSTLVEGALAGNDVQIVFRRDNQGPNALANIIANSIGSGRQVLVLSKDPQIMSRIETALSHGGMGDYVLKLDRLNDAGELASEIRRAVLLGAPKPAGDAKLDTSIALNSKKILDDHAKHLLMPVSDSGFNTYELYSKLLTLREEKTSAIKVPSAVLTSWGRAEIEKALVFAKEVERFFAENGQHNARDLLATSATALSDPVLQRFSTQSVDASEKAQVAIRKCKALFAPLNFSNSLSEDDLSKSLHALKVIDEIFTEDGGLLEKINLSDERWVSMGQIIVDALAVNVELSQRLKHFNQKINLNELISTDLDQLETQLNIHSKRGRLGRIFLSEEDDWVRQAGRIAKNSDVTPEQLLGMLVEWKKIKPVAVQAQENGTLIKELFGSLIDKWNVLPGDFKSWQKLLPLGESIVELTSVCSSHPDKKVILQHFLNPTSIYDLSEMIEIARLSLVEYKQARDALSNLLGLGSEDQQSLFYSRTLSAQLEMLSPEKVSAKWDFSAIDKYRELSKKARALGYQFLLQALVDSPECCTNLANSLEKAWYQSHAKRNLEEASKENQAITSIELQRSAYITGLLNLCNAHTLSLAKRHYDQLPNVSCGGRASSIADIVEGTSVHDSGVSIIEDTIDVLHRIKPIILADPEEIRNITDKLEDRFATVIVDGGLTNNALAEISQLGVKAKQLILVGRDNKIQPIQQDVVNKDSFANYVSDKLIQNGFSISKQKQIGSEIAEIVVSLEPTSSGSLVAIRTDGPQYYNNQSTYEREFASDGVIESAGVPVVRVWIKEWIDDSSEALEHLIARLKSISELGISSADLTINRQYHNAVSREEVKTNLASISVPYQIANLNNQECTERYEKTYVYAGHTSSAELIFWKERIKQIVEKEGPIHSDLLKQRIALACGLTRPGDKLNVLFTDATKESVISKSIRMDGSFYSIPKQKEIVPRNRSGIVGLDRIGYISKNEIEATVLGVVKRSCGISLEDLILQSQDALGLNDNMNGVDSVVEATVEGLLSSNVITKDASGLFDFRFNRLI